MTKTRQTTLLVLCMTLFIGSNLALAQPGPHGFRGGPGGKRLARIIEENAEELGLSEQTVAGVRAIVAEGKKERRRLKDELHVARHQLRLLLSAENVDEEAVMKQAEILGNLQTKALKHRLQTLLRLRPLLTDAQLEQVRQLHRERAESVRKACRAEIDTLCPETHRGPGLGRCLRRHEGELSDTCTEAFAAFRPRHGRRGPGPDEN